VRATRRIVSGAIGLIVLTLAGIASVYQVLFSLWMTAYPMADINFWRPHLYLRLGQTLLIGLFWVGLAVWMVRMKKSG